jgi:hypothetical protein
MYTKASPTRNLRANAPVVIASAALLGAAAWLVDAPTGCALRCVHTHAAEATVPITAAMAMLFFVLFMSASFEPPHEQAWCQCLALRPAPVAKAPK